MKLSVILKWFFWLALGLTAGAYFTPTAQVAARLPVPREGSSFAASGGVENAPGHEAADPFAPKSAQLAAMLKEADPWRELTGLLAYVDSLGPDDFPKAFEQLRSAPDTNRDETLDLLLGRWMEVDPRGAVNSLARTRGMENQDFAARAITDIYDAWSEKDPDGALAQARQALSGTERRTALKVILGNMAREDPVKALELIKGRQGGFFSVDSPADYIIPVFTSWAARDVPAATQTLLQLTDNDERNSALVGMAAGLVRRDPLAAADWVNQLPPGKMRDAAVGDVANLWGEADPAAAMTWLDRLPPFGAKHSVLDDVALDWATHDAAGALAHGMDLPDGQEKSSLLTWGLAQLTYDDAPSAVRWVESLPPSPLQKNSFATLFDSWTDYDPPAAAAYLATLPEGDARQNAIETVAQAWSANDPAAAAQWVAGLPDGPSKAAADAAVARIWFSSDPAPAAAWVGQLPLGVVRDGAARSLSDDLVRSDPAGAVRWAESISDSQARQDQIVAVIRQSIQRDPFDAADLVKNAPLPEDEKKKLLEKAPKVEVFPP